MNSISQMQNRFFRAALTLALVSITFLLSSFLGFGNGLKANAAPMTPEATEYQVNGNPFKAEQEAGKENFQDTANRMFQENKKPLEAPETTQKIGEALTKTPKETKKKIEGIAGNVQEATDTVKDKVTNAYEDQKNKPPSDITNVLETVKEKLNLDQPIYPPTKEFINDIEEKASETIKGTQQAIEDAAS